MKWVENSYDSFLDFGAHHWWTIVLPSLGLLALTGWLIFERPKAFIPTEDQGYLIVVVQTPDGTTQEPTSRAPQRVGQIAGELHGVRDVLILDGYNADHRDQPDQHRHGVRDPRGVAPPDRARAAGRRPGARAPAPSCPSRSARRGWRSSSPRRSRA